MVIKDENGKVTGGSFRILGSDAPLVTKVIVKETYEHAVECRKNLKESGCRQVQIYDVNWRKMEERPERGEPSRASSSASQCLA